jgi:small-conductance mechanosensitive channel
VLESHDLKLFEIGGTPVTVATLVTAVAVIVSTIVLSRVIRHAVSNVLERTRAGERAVRAVTGLLHYVLLLAGFGIALQTVGINLSALFAAGALFAVALGFAMQSVSQNFVAGVILLSERSIHPGDILEVEGTLVRVVDMGIRAITAETRDGENLIIPNAVLIQTTVKNFTLINSAVRIRVPVGVVYGSDMALVRETLLRVATELSAEWGVADRSPQVILTEFGNHSVNWEVAVWMSDPWESRNFRSRLHDSVWWAFKENGIVIAFPQLDVHFDPAVAQGLARGVS